MATKKEKIEYVALTVAVVGIAFVLYFFVFKPAPAPAPVAASTSSVPAATASLLPNGTSLQTGILSNTSFTSLAQPVYPQVNPSEVGNPNLFVQPAAAPAQQGH